MDRMGKKFLPGSAFAQNQNGHIVGGHAPGHLLDLFHLSALADNILKVVASPMDFTNLVAQFQNPMGVGSQFVAQGHHLGNVTDDGNGAYNLVFEYDGADIGDIFDVIDLPPHAQQCLACL